jgi:hypothetical protein
MHSILVQWWSKTKPTKSTKTKRKTMLDYFPHMSQCIYPGEDRIWSPLNKNTMHLFSYLRQENIGVYRTSAVRSFACPSRRHTFSSLRHTFKFCSDGTKTKRNTMLDYFPHMSQCIYPGEDRIWSPLNKNTMHLFSGCLSRFFLYF